MKNAKPIKWLLTLAGLLAALCVFALAANAKIVDSGACGSNLTWTLDDAGTLTIRGAGAMAGYDSRILYDDDEWDPPSWFDPYEDDWIALLLNPSVSRDLDPYLGTTAPWCGASSWDDDDDYYDDEEYDESIYFHYVGYETYPSIIDPKLLRIYHIVIENGVTTIGDNAFSFCANLKSVTIPASVTRIGKEAFLNCTDLKDVTIMGNVTSIGKDVFARCPAIAKLTVGKTIENFSVAALKIQKKKLQTVEIVSGVTGIGKGAFSDCIALTDVTIPDSVTSIGASAFSGCTSLTGVKIPSGVTGIESAVFSGCANLTDVTVPAGVTSIGASAFYGCARLTGVAIPSGVTDIGASAFSGCTRLTGVTIPDGVTSLESSVFSGCAGLTDMTIPDGVTSIGRHAFSGCAGLTDVTVPDSVTSIGEKAFSGCTGLTDVTIGNGVTSVGEGVFSGCNAIDTLTVGQPIGSFTLAELAVPKDKLRVVVIADGAAGIKRSAFAGYPGIAAFTVADANPAYLSEDGILYDKNKTEIIQYPPAKAGTSFVIPETVMALAERAFADQQYLTEIHVPNQVKTLGKDCFTGCQSLKTAVCGGGAAALPEGMLMDCPALETVTIPYGVSAVGAKAFSGCTALTSVAMSNDMETVGENAFSGCKALDTVYFYGTADEWTAIGVKAGNEALTGARKVFRAAVAPQTVTGVKVVKTGGRTVTLQWAPADGATEYRVYGMNAETSTWELLKTVTGPRCEIAGLKPGTAYALAVEAAAVTAKGTLTADKSDPVMVTTKAVKQAPGDVDGDGELSSGDARLALRASVGLEKAIAKGSDAWLAADADGDGEVTSGDARLILRASVGLEDASKFGKKA